jgi:DNA polymerase-3 subunit delta'
MPFSPDIVGHENQLAALRQALEQERLHHAYVFLGPDGVGKRTIALALAKAVHCLEMTRDFCGRCANCSGIENHNHPDVRLLQPLPGKKDISIEQVRTLERELSYRAFSGRKKIAIIDPAPLMNFSAQNALLKTLEEPPAGSLLILISTSAGGLLPTLLSRCLRLSFGPLPASAVADYLVSRRDQTPEQAKLLAAVSLGSLGRAASSDVEELAEKRGAWVDAIALLAKGDGAAWPALAEELSKDREEALKFLNWLSEWYRDMLIYHATENFEAICNVDLSEKLKAQAESSTLERTLFLRSQTLAAAQLIRRNINRRMALENLFANVAGLPK